jgi:hypothetical protein
MPDSHQIVAFGNLLIPVRASGDPFVAFRNSSGDTALVSFRRVLRCLFVVLFHIDLQLLAVVCLLWSLQTGSHGRLIEGFCCCSLHW